MSDLDHFVPFNAIIKIIEAAVVPLVFCCSFRGRTTHLFSMVKGHVYNKTKSLIDSIASLTMAMDRILAVLG